MSNGERTVDDIVPIAASMEQIGSEWRLPVVDGIETCAADRPGV